MGFLDKIKQSLTPPDHAAVIAERLNGEAYLAHIAVMASASETDRKQKMARDLTDIAQDAAHRLTDKVIEKRHIGGDDSSIVWSLPRRQEPIVLALGEGSITFWSFGMGGRKSAPDLIAKVPRHQVVSIADTGKRTVRGHVRFSFTDGSFIDYQTLQTPSAEFWEAAESYGSEAPGDGA